MIRINALNDASASLSDGVEGPVTTKEAQEEAAYCLYNKALEFQKQGDNAQAEDTFKQLLQTQFLSKVVPPEEGEETPLSPAHTLKYLAFKNMASIAAEKKDYHQAMESYLEAANIDASDVSLWFRMGLVALKLHNYPLARVSFEEGLKCNPKHWPCLDNVITVLYALNDYANCLYYISKALERECYFTKGLVFRDQIYKEHAGLHSFCDEYFINCDQSIYTAAYDKEEAQKLIDEALAMREKKREISKSPPLPVLKFQQPLLEFKWKQLGERLIALYDYIKNSNPRISFGCRVDLQMYLNNGEKPLPEVNADQEKCPASPATASSSFDSINSTSPPTSAPSSQPNEQLQLCPPEQVLVEEPPVLMEIEETPLGCSVMTSPNIDTKSPQPEIIPYLDATSLPIVCSRRRGPKRKRLLMESMECGIKRRSARVRNTGKKHQEHACVNYQDLLKKFLPPTLCDTKEQEEESSLVNDLEASLYETDRNSGNDAQEGENKSSKVTMLSSSEADDVKKFLSDNQKNSGVLDLLYKYLVELSARSELQWYSGLVDIYIAGYSRSREHFTLPSLFTQNTEFEAVKDQGLMTLLFFELKMDKWHAKGPPETLSTSLKGSNYIHFEQDLGKYFMEDMDFLIQMSVLRCVLGDYLETFYMRVLWMKGRFYIFDGDIEAAVRCFEQLSDLLQEMEDETKNPVKQCLVNCSSMSIITKEQVKEQLESLQRCQSLEEVHRLYDQGDYQAVVDLLVSTFRQAQARRKVSNDGTIPERYAQLRLLHDSLWKLENYQDCLIWGEAGFDEALTQYMTVLSASDRTVWAQTMTHLLSGLDKCINSNKGLLDKMNKAKLVRLANNLINLISLQMLVAETALERDIPTVAPWILLYHIIKHEEVKIQTENVKTSSSLEGMETQIVIDPAPKLNPQEGDFGLGMPSSLMLLFTAHECLGRFSWCSGSDGALLLLSVDVMSSELQRSTPTNPNPFREDLESGLEQCFYCLYGHPNKRTKAKHLQEHNAHSITLTWERSQLLFEYFKPSILPEFDSYRTNAVSAELENLLRRISLLIPSEDDPLTRIDGVIAYIEGGTDKLPTLPSDKPSPSPIVKDLYYLLGDYYFKNKEFGKAIKYYSLDICVNPKRFDSWAGMALARSSQLEQKLSCCDLKNEGAIYRKSTSALRCFKQALELDSTHTSLWIEYGSIAYMLHSHTSRQLKQQSQLNFGDDVLELLQKKKEEMLSTAENCFLSAKRCEMEGVDVDEVWLYHYMLGKIAEKKSEHPKVYLEHYKQAAKYLHEDEARYPKKIHYPNPPELSIEALEIYYRTHASVLKNLFRHKDSEILQADLELYKVYLTEAANSPFAKFQEKSERDSIRIMDYGCEMLFMKLSFSRYTSLSSSEAEDTSLALPTAKRRAKKAVARDHDYFQGQKQICGGVKLESTPQKQHRVSVDSSSESQDSAAVKDVLNSIVAVVSESCGENENHEGPTIVLGDHKIHKFTRKNDNVAPSPNSPPPSSVSDNNFVSDFISAEENVKISKDELCGISIEAVKTLPIVVIERLNQNTEILLETVRQENVAKVQETIEEFMLPNGNNNDLPEEKPVIQSSNNLIGNLENENKPEECLALLEIEKINDELKEIVKKQELESKGIVAETEEAPVTVDDIYKQCLAAIKNCLQRFTQHYKSLYRIAHYYCYSAKNKNIALSREVLLGSATGNTIIGHQGLFAERKNTNFFNGIWRIPIDEIDRPGSFGAHMYRSIVLLIEVLDQLEDHAMLLHLTLQLSRIPDLGKKYLRDTDRAYLAREAFSRCLKVHRNQMNNLLQEEPPPEESRLISCLLDIFRTWQSLQKAAVFPELANELLEEAYSMYKLGEVDPSPPVLEQAIRFCQVQQLKQNNSQMTQDMSRNLIISGIFVKPAESVTDTVATPYTAITSTTETPTNEVGQTANEPNLENLPTLFVSQNSTLSLAYISPLDLQTSEVVATSSQVPSASHNQYQSCNFTPYVTCPVQINETVPTISTVAEPASAMNVITGARCIAPYTSINTMRKRWQTHGGRRHRFGVSALKPYVQLPVIKTDVNIKSTFPSVMEPEKQHSDKK